MSKEYEISWVPAIKAKDAGTRYSTFTADQFTSPYTEESIAKQMRYEIWCDMAEEEIEVTAKYQNVEETAKLIAAELQGKQRLWETKVAYQKAQRDQRDEPPMTAKQFREDA